MERVSELGGWVLGGRGMVFHEEEILGSLYGEKEQIKSMLGGCSGAGVQGLDIARDILETGMQRLAVRGKLGDERGRGYVKFLGNMFYRAGPGEPPAGLVFYQRGEGDIQHFCKLPHGHAASFPLLFQRGRKTIWGAQKTTSLFLA